MKVSLLLEGEITFGIVLFHVRAWGFGYSLYCSILSFWHNSWNYFGRNIVRKDHLSLC
jgi:hypothetical protein